LADFSGHLPDFSVVDEVQVSVSPGRESTRGQQNDAVGTVDERILSDLPCWGNPADVKRLVSLVQSVNGSVREPDVPIRTLSDAVGKEVIISRVSSESSRIVIDRACTVSAYLAYAIITCNPYITITTFCDV
jgi:hypothetical protein